MPNDGTNTNPDQIGTPNPPFDVLSDIEHFAAFMRVLALRNPPILNQVACCHLCHTPALTTDPNSRVAALSGPLFRFGASPNGHEP